jgi:hypothetical protein
MVEGDRGGEAAERYLSPGPFQRTEGMICVWGMTETGA